ncbi:MAG: RNA-binding transcriptional accessory protein [Candidatus Gracilibacteria bacterium]|nr:RNA-binding transcriptional accessory protein [Candidatus Gracilibacteria bacterium]
MQDLVQKISNKTGMKTSSIEAIIKLLDEGNTIPFIARYRKELTGGASDETLRDFNDIYEYAKNLESRKEDVIRLIDEKGMLTPELKKDILNAETLARVEDLYRPFKEKKNTRATIAKAKGLEPLADILALADMTKEEFEAEAEKFIKENKDPKKAVKTKQEAIKGAQDIIAEMVADDADLRGYTKEKEEEGATLVTKATKKFDEEGTYKIYKDYKKKISAMPSYAYLAVSRAEKEKELSVKLDMYEEKIIENGKYKFTPENPNTSVVYLKEAITDGLKRLMLPSIEREIRSDKKKWADLEAIKVFGENMRGLLLTPPVRGKTILAIDPGFRTGCKVAVLDATGKFLDNSVLWHVPPRNDIAGAYSEIVKLTKKHNVDLIVIGNGTASRETEKFVNEVIKKADLSVDYMVVNEAGASVYSASKLATEEYPELDVTVRGAISIGHRVQDSLAELTKIDPKSIGVGQYQHDVDQKLLAGKLDEKVEDTVNAVGVDVNTASYTLLSYIAGLTKKIAQNVVSYRNENGEFTKRSEIKKVKGLGPKGFEQAIGFLRIKGGKEVLDETGIHPETYKTTYAILEKEFDIKKKDLKLPINLEISDSKIRDFSEKYEIGFETLNDIFKELATPGLDPRENIEAPKFKSDVLEITDLKEGMILDGVVRNVTDFGAFVDIGLHSDGLVHISQLSDNYVSNPSDVVTVGQNVEVKVIEIDKKRERVSLSMKGL